MGEWREQALSDVLELQRGHDLPAADRLDGDVPIIGSFGITGTHHEAKYEGPGVAIGRSGASIGVATYVDAPYWPLNTCLFVKDFKGNSPRWIYHLLQIIDFHGFNSGSAQPSLNRNFLKGIPVRVPCRAEQEAIAEVLGALDDKIAANERVALAAEGLLEAESAKVVDSAERFTPLTSCAEVRKGVSYRSADLQPSTTALVTLKSVTRTGGFSHSGFKDYVGEFSGDQVLETGDIVVAQTDITQGGEVIGRAVRIPSRESYSTLVASLDLAIVRPLEGIPSEYLLAVLRGRKFRAHCASYASGTTVLHLGKGAFETYDVPLVDSDAAASYSEYAASVHAHVDAIAAESRALAKTRDQLLPLLMSGKVTVKDVENEVGGLV